MPPDLCPALPSLGRSRSERIIHLYNGDSSDLLLRLERGDLDAVVGSMRLTSPRLTYAAIHPETMVSAERPKRSSFHPSTTSTSPRCAAESTRIRPGTIVVRPLARLAHVERDAKAHSARGGLHLAPRELRILVDR